MVIGRDRRVLGISASRERTFKGRQWWHHIRLGSLLWWQRPILFASVQNQAYKDTVVVKFGVLRLHIRGCEIDRILKVLNLTGLTSQISPHT